MKAKDIVKVLKIAGQTVATAESCTGGWVAKKITDVEGASEVFKYGVVSYSDEAKMKLLGVKEETLKEYTAVSAQTAIEMAEGVRHLADSDIGISVTGYASGMGELNGRVFIAVSNKKGYNKVLQKDYSDHLRDSVRSLAVEDALDLIIEGALKNAALGGA